MFLVYFMPFQISFWRCTPILAQHSKGMGGWEEGHRQVGWKRAEAAHNCLEKFPSEDTDTPEQSTGSREAQRTPP